jgi:hypothetical protein
MEKQQAVRGIPFIALICAAALLGSNGSAQEEEASPADKEEAKAEFAKADRELNEAWAAVKKAWPEGEFQKLKQDQRAWVEYCDYLAHSPMYADVCRCMPMYAGVGRQDDVGSDSPEYLSAAAGLSKMRTGWLKGW